jgi:predicted nucleic acid-binding protein
MSLPRRYWDSCAFLAWLLPEPEREDACRSVLRAAEDGELELVTSAFTLTEVIKLKGKTELKIEHERKIADFFKSDFIILRNVDRFVAVAAQRLVWEHNVAPKDAIHVATALHWKIPVLDTFDDVLLGLNGKLAIESGNPASPLLQITTPHVPIQLDLGLPGDAESKQEEEEPEKE